MTGIDLLHLVQEQVNSSEISIAYSCIFYASTLVLPCSVMVHSSFCFLFFVFVHFTMLVYANLLYKFVYFGISVCNLYVFYPNDFL